MKKEQYRIHEMFGFQDGNDDILSDIGNTGEIRHSMWALMPYSVSDGSGVINEDFISFVLNRNKYPTKKLPSAPYLIDRFNECVGNIKETLKHVGDKKKFYNNLLELQNYLIRGKLYDKEPLLKEIIELDEQNMPAVQPMSLERGDSDDIANGFTKKLDLGAPQYLGGGSNGYAYTISGNKVLKLTTDACEVDAAMKMLRGEPKRLVHIFNIYKIFDTVKNFTVYGLIEDFIAEKPVNDFIKYENILNTLGADNGYDFAGIMIILRKNKIPLDDLIETTKFILTEKPEANISQADREATYKFIVDIIEIKRELNEYDIKSKDYGNRGNLGYKNGVLTYFDIGSCRVEEPQIPPENVIDLPEGQEKINNDENFQLKKDRLKFAFDKILGINLNTVLSSYSKTGKFNLDKEKIKKYFIKNPGDFKTFKILIKKAKELKEDGSALYSTDNSIGTDNFPAYNQNDSSPLTDNNVPANTSVYNEDLEYRKVSDATQDEYVINERIKSSMPGSSSVEVKKKCRLAGNGNTSTACNQGDINNLNLSPIRETVNWQGFAYRVPTGFKYPKGATAGDVVRYEQNELDNDYNISDEKLLELDKYPANNIIWVTKSFKNAKRYSDTNDGSDVKKYDLRGEIIAEDGDGGYLILVKNSDFEKPIRESVNINLPSTDNIGGYGTYQITNNGQNVGTLSIIDREIQGGNRYIVVDKIFIEPEFRGEGYANDAIKILFDFADKHNMIITLTPDNLWGSNVNKLKKWYKSLGFTENKGKDKDFQTMQLMYRLPNIGKNENFNIFTENLEQNDKLTDIKCHPIPLTPEIEEYLKKFNSDDELLKKGGLPTDLLDIAAFGFSEETLKHLLPKQLFIKWKDDLENVLYEVQKSGLSKAAWARKINLDEPIDVSFDGNKFYLEDGHHRYYAAKILGLPLNVNLEIKANPITKLGADLNYDNFHRCIWKQVNNQMNENIMNETELMSLQDLPFKEEVEKLGGQIFSVGGAVRDEFLGKESKDLDILITGIPMDKLEQILSHYGRVDAVGKSFGVLKFKPEGSTEDIDVAIPRTEKPTGTGGHKGFEVSSDHALPIDDDLKRRDYTINAIAKDINGNIIDPYGGQQDLQNKIIRVVNPDAFSDDPLRMLRGIQFASRFGFTIEPNTMKMIRDNASRIKEIPPERILIELDKIVKKGDKLIGVDLLKKSGLFKEIFGNDLNLNKSEPWNQVNDMGEFIFLMTKNILNNPAEFYLKNLKGDINSYKVIKALDLAFKNNNDNPLITRSIAHNMYSISPSSLESQILPPSIKIAAQELLQGKYPKTIGELAVNGNDLKALGLKGKEIGDTLKMMLMKIYSDKIDNNKEELLKLVNSSEQ